MTTSATRPPCDPLGHLTKYGYDLDHRQISATDAANFAASQAYDLDGQVISTTDQNGNTTLYTLDPRGDVTQVKVPYTTSGGTTTYDITQYVYDQVGNKIKTITPRGVAAGVTSTCTSSCAFTQQTVYDADNRVKAQLSAYDPNDPTVAYRTPAETDYTYDVAGRLIQVSAPPSGTQTVRNVSTYSYFDNGWHKSATDPWDITTSYDYNSLGAQTTRTITSAGGDMSRTMTWGYYPDGKLQSVTDNGVPTGLYSELADNSDFNNVTSTGTWNTASGASGFEGYDYVTHAAGSGPDSFTWHLHIPADGNYTVYVKYPAVSGAATNASYTVSYNGGTATATVDQTKGAGTWVALGKWAFTQAGNSQNVTLAENSGGTVTADAVKVVRDDSSDTNTAVETFGYAYDPNGNLTGITDSSLGTTVPSYQATYDGLGEVTKVTENSSSGAALHTTTYGYDADGNMTSRGHDSATSSYAYDARNLLVKETDAQSASDPSPQVATFTYTPDEQQATETKPNSNTVASTYYANGLLQNQTENASGGTLVSSHAYSYDPNGNKAQDIEKLMSADNNSSYLSHTLAYTYDPRDRISTVSKDGTVTESYTHDANDNVIADTINSVPQTFSYDRNRLLTATSNGSTTDYNYDPLGRLDSVTSAGRTVQSNTYDGFDRIIAHQQINSSLSLDTTDYTYDPLSRLTSQTTQAGTSNAQTTTYQYLGLTSELTTELQKGTPTKSYTYTPYGERLSQITDNPDGSHTPGYYTYNDHNDVEAVTGQNGGTTATYGYTAYGNNDTSMFTGADKNDSNPSSTTQPFNAYRFNAMRWDSSSGQYDMGFRTYDSSLNGFLSRDMYNGALSDMALDTDPFTGNRYTFGAGNPVSNIELDGHMPACDGNRQCIAAFEKSMAEAARNMQPAVTVTRDPGQRGFVIVKYDGMVFRVPDSDSKVKAENIPVRDFFNGQLAKSGNLYSGKLVGGTSGSGEVYLATFEGKTPKGQKTPDFLRVTYENGQPVGVTRVDLYKPAPETQMSTILGEVGKKLAGQADEVIIQAEGRSPQQVKDILDATKDLGGARTVIQLGGSRPIAVRAEAGEGAPEVKPSDVEPGLSAGDEAGLEGGDLLGPLWWILMYADAQRHGGLFSPGGCAVFGIPSSACPFKPQPFV